MHLKFLSDYGAIRCGEIVAVPETINEPTAAGLLASQWAEETEDAVTYPPPAPPAEPDTTDPVTS